MAGNLANLIVPAVFGNYVAAGLAKSNAFVKSGAAINSPQLSALLGGGAAVFSLPMWKNLSATSLMPSSDVAELATAQKMQAGKQIALRVLRAATPVAVTDLEGMIIGEDPVAEAVRQYVDVHASIRQKTLVDMLKAVTAADTAALTYDSTATAGSAELVAEACANKFGDRVRGLVGLTLVMNSIEYLDFQKTQAGAPGIVVANAVDLGFGTVSGASIVIDDDVPANTIFVVRPGGIAFGTAAVATPFEVLRKPDAGNAGGADIIYSRDLYSYHVAGTTFDAAIAGEMATDAEIALAASWSLALDPKLCGAIAITHD